MASLWEIDVVDAYEPHDLVTISVNSRPTQYGKVDPRQGWPYVMYRDSNGVDIFTPGWCTKTGKSVLLHIPWHRVLEVRHYTDPQPED